MTDTPCIKPDGSVSYIRTNHTPESMQEATASGEPDMRPFNVQHYGTVPWWIGHQAWLGYVKRFPCSAYHQDTQRIHERGGFDVTEMDEFYPQWRDEVSLIVQLQRQIAKAESTITELRAAIVKACGMIEVADMRLLASDGPCGGVPPDMTLEEWREMYLVLDAARNQDSTNQRGE